MVTRVETSSQPDSWKIIRNLPPGEIGSFSNNLEDGTREVYAYVCARDDSETSIHKLLPGIEAKIGHRRTIDKHSFSLEGVLRREDEPFEMNIKTDRFPEAKQIRLTHI